VDADAHNNENLSFKFLKLAAWQGQSPQRGTKQAGLFLLGSSETLEQHFHHGQEKQEEYIRRITTACSLDGDAFIRDASGKE
jgi:hypothetical protein